MPSLSLLLSVDRALSIVPVVVGGGGGGGWWCLNVNLVIGFCPSLGLALWPRAKPINM